MHVNLVFEVANLDYFLGLPLLVKPQIVARFVNFSRVISKSRLRFLYWIFGLESVSNFTFFFSWDLLFDLNL